MTDNSLLTGDNLKDYTTVSVYSFFWGYIGLSTTLDDMVKSPFPFPIAVVSVSNRTTRPFKNIQEEHKPVFSYSLPGVFPLNEA